MSCCDDFGNCDQGRDCPVRSAPAGPAKVAVARPLYRRCDIAGACPQPDAQCRERCLLAADDEQPLSQAENVAIWLVIALAMSLLLVLLGGVVGYFWELLR